MKHLPFLTNKNACAIAAAVVMIPASAALADVIVMSSDVPGIAKGAVLKDDAVLEVPAPGKLNVIIKPDDVTMEIIGPFKGTAKDYRAKSAVGEAMSKPASTYDELDFAGSPPPDASKSKKRSK